MDLLDDAVFQGLLAGIDAGEITALILGPPCSSFSVLRERRDFRGPRIRARSQPEGVTPCPPRWEGYVRDHNLLCERTCALALRVWQRGGDFVIENPIDRGDPDAEHGQYWPRAAGHTPMWLTRWIRDLRVATGAVPLHNAQCMLGGDFQKWTTWLCSPRLARQLAWFGKLACIHEPHEHADPRRRRRRDNP